jgi:hypothetical protein
MPKDAEFAVEFVAVLKFGVAFIDADKLVVLGDDFLGFAVFVAIQNEVFDIIEQFFGNEEAVDQPIEAGSGVADVLPINFFGFVVGAQPLKEAFREHPDYAARGMGA